MEETKDFGNVFVGWKNYVSTEKIRSSKKIANDDRLFSLSSVTSPASRREELKKAPKSEGSAKKTNKKRKSVASNGLDGDATEAAACLPVIPEDEDITR